MKPTKFDAVGVNLKVLVDEEGDWFDGIVEAYHPKKGYHIQLFDGQDLWLDSLNERVQFEEEYETGEINLRGDSTVKSSTGFVEDELEILGEDEYFIAGATTTDNKLAVPDYHSHQEYNQRSIRADLVNLPSRGVLLTGSVLGTAGLVIDEAMDGEVFFKVLFVEGGSQPAMFRCKTPIYTSDAVVCSLADPRWDNARFQFDMIMPEDTVNDKKQPFGFKIQGEIIIAVYVSRSSGGSSLLGQASFQLKDALETGTVEFFASGYEGRSITGAHTLLSRAGEVSGEVDVQLNIAWKSLSPVGGTTTSQTQLLRASNGAGGLSRPSSAARPSTSSKTGLNTTSKVGGASATKTATGSGLPPKRPASAVAKGTIAPPRSIVSNLQRKQREDAARIARENEKLQQNLQKHANRNGRPSATAATVGTAYGPQTASSIAAGAKSYNNTSTLAEAKSTSRPRDEANGAKNSSGGSAKGTSDAQNIDTLLKIYNGLKREVALDEQENVRLKLKVGKLKVSVKQAEMSAERLRNQPGAGNTSSGNSRAKTATNSNRSSRESLFGSDPKDVLRSSTSRLPTPTQGQQQQAKDVAGSGVAKAGAHAYIPFFEPLSEAEMKAQKINDSEYTSLAEEYCVLQSVRRGLLDRARAAQTICEEATGKQSTAAERMEMIRRRVCYYRDIAGKLSVGVDLGLGAEGPNNASRAGAKGSADDDGDHDDFVLFDRLRDAKQEYTAENALYEAGLHIVAHESAMEELQAVRAFLTDKCDGAEGRIRALKEDIEKLHQALRDALRRDSPPSYAEELLKARASGSRSSTALNKEAADRLEASQVSINAVDQELRGIQSRRESRRESRNESGQQESRQESKQEAREESRPESRRNSFDDFTLSPDNSMVQ